MPGSSPPAGMQSVAIGERQRDMQICDPTTVGYVRGCKHGGGRMNGYVRVLGQLEIANVLGPATFNGRSSVVLAVQLIVGGWRYGRCK